MTTVTLTLENLSDKALETLSANGCLPEAANVLRKRREGVPVRNAVFKSGKALYFVHEARQTTDGRVMHARYTRLTNTFGELVREEEGRTVFLTTISPDSVAQWVLR